MNPAVFEYYAARQCDPQWRLFFASAGKVLGEKLKPEVLRALFFEVGVDFAKNFDLSRCKNFEDLQLEISKVLSERHWGWISIQRQQKVLTIRHNCASFYQTFGPVNAAWSSAFFEGALDHWFKSVGNSDEIRVVEIEGSHDQLHIEFELTRG